MYTVFAYAFEFKNVDRHNIPLITCVSHLIFVCIIRYNLHVVNNYLRAFCTQYQGGTIMFNKRLREMRMKRKFTQQHMADTLGIALRSYQCYETGTRTPNYSLLVLIADALDVSLDYLLCRDDWLKLRGASVDESR